MSDDLSAPEGDLIRELTALQSRLVYPSTPDIAAAVGAPLRQSVCRPASPLPRRLYTLRYPALAALAILVSVFAVSPDARSAAASWFHLPGFEILPGGPVQGPLGRGAQLGTRVSLREAQRRVRFSIVVPALPDLRRPDEVYVGTPPLSANSASLVYRARPGFPRAATTGAGLLITEFQRRSFDAKRLPPGVVPRIVWINHQPGMWLAGAPHVLYYEDWKGRIIRDTGRLAGNVLVWRRGDVVLRVEGRLSLQRALAVADSMR